MKTTLLIAGLLAAPVAAAAQTATPSEPQGQANASTTVEKIQPAKPERPAAAPSGVDKALKEKPAQPAKVEAPPPAPRFDPLGGVPNPPLTPKEKQGVAYGKQWKGNRDRPARGADGAVVYVFGATLPTIVCAPLYVCDLVLEGGEAVKSVNVGDSVRWQIAPAEQGSGESVVTHIIIKPTDVGLLTNMVITTDRRAYVIKLVSRGEDWMPRVSFSYPSEQRQSWSAYRAGREREQEARAAAPVEPSGPFDYGYRLSGDQPAWRPVQVYTNGAKTFIQFPPEAAHSDLPALVAIAEDNSFLGLETAFNGPKTQLVNYRLVDGSRFEVDKVLSHAALISGVREGRP
jgi:P-type conjugative transfer protein TrbG